MMKVLLPLACAALLGGYWTATPVAKIQERSRDVITCGYGGRAGAGGELLLKTFDQLCREAEAVVLARVIGNHCLWNSEQTLIWTETHLAIRECWKGDLLAEVRVREPGGVIPPVGLEVSVAARYRPGEEVVVFLVHDVLGQWRTLGVTQGRFAVRAGRHGERMVSFGRTPTAVPLQRFKGAFKELAGRKGRGR